MDGPSSPTPQLVCPVCRTSKPLTEDGRVVRHNGETMRWSGRRWFGVACTGSGKRPVEVSS